MREEKNLDSLFREGIGKEYPYDPKLWAAMEHDLHVAFPPRAVKRIVFFTIVAALFTISGIGFTLLKYGVETKPLHVQSQHGGRDAIVQFERREDKPISSNFIIQNEKIASSADVNRTSVDQLEAQETKTASTTNEMRKSRLAPVRKKSAVKKVTPKPVFATAENAENPTPNDKQIVPVENANPFIPTSKADFLKRMAPREQYNFAHLEVFMPLQQPFDPLNVGWFRKGYHSVQVEQLWHVNGKKKVEQETENELRQQYRKSSEHFMSSSEKAALISFYHKKLTFQIGIGQKVIQEKINYMSEKEYTRLVESLGERVLVTDNFNSNGRDIALIGRKKIYTEVRDTATENLYNGVNKFNFVKVPMRLGLTQHYGRFTLGVWGASDITMFSSFKGTYINTDLSDVYTESQLPQRNKLNLELGFGAQFGYHVWSNWNMGATFQQKYMMNSTHKMLSQKFNTAYVGWFLQYSF